MYARIINNVAIDVSDNPEESFHPDVALEFVSVPEDVRCGWKLVDNVWEPPADIVEPEISLEPKEVDPITFKLLFTSAERVAAKALRSSDPLIDDFWAILDDPRTASVNMKIPSIQAAIEHTLDAINAASERKNQILQGIIQ